MFGVMTEALLAALGDAVRGKSVLDIGAGDCQRTRMCLDVGAKSVVAAGPDVVPRAARGWTVFQGYIDQYRGPKPDVVLLSWPTTYRYAGIERHLADTEVVYIGCNTRGTGCGHASLWDVLLTREVLCYAPHPRNTPIHYAAASGPPREGLELYPEEASAFYEGFHDYEPHPGPLSSAPESDLVRAIRAGAQRYDPYAVLFPVRDAGSQGPSGGGLEP